ncbi:MAG TPA: class I SAM-dependent methyltransferase [Bacteroidia bacterium]|jgi:ubiquinone/menaquinone biosynthesis C-methylase UbiE|nr:class I SAM-dependent methyltransferase [Bacteroidia bacterium]
MLKIASNPSKHSAQEQFYTALRKKEGRMYNDTEVKELPHVPKKHPLAAEWKVRKHTAQKLVKYFSNKQKPLRILEIGCGNGWLCHQLSFVPNSTITGLDVNMYEMEQADRVFQSVLNINFIYGDIFEDILPEKSFDTIVFAASIQYFSSITEVLDRVIPLLSPNGETHIIDSPFYNSDKEASEAKERSAVYFEKHGAANMALYYNHHLYSSLAKYKHTIKKPSLMERLLKKSYFPWVIVSGK